MIGDNGGPKLDPLQEAVLHYQNAEDAIRDGDSIHCELHTQRSIAASLIGIQAALANIMTIQREQHGMMVAAAAFKKKLIQ